MKKRPAPKKKAAKRKKARPPGSAARPSKFQNLVKRPRPDPPTGVMAHGHTQTEIMVQWQPTAHADSYLIWRASSSSGPFMSHATATAPTFLDTGLLPGQTFCYQILGIDGLGRSNGPSAPVCATTSTLPVPVSGLIGQAVSSTTIVLSWPMAAGAAYYVVWGADSSAGPFNTIGTTNVASYTLTGLLPGRTYCYLVLFVNSAGSAQQPSGPPVCVTTPAITVPQNVHATTQSERAILVTWNPVAGATRFDLFRSTNAAGPFSTSAGTSITNSFTDTGLSANRTYYYAVTASGSGYTSPMSPPASALTAPSVPWPVTAQALSPASVEVKWSASPGAVRYDVYRASNPNGQGTVKVGSPTGTTFTDTVPSGSTWHYWVTASNAGGESAQSSRETATTPPAAPAITLSVVSIGNVRIDWAAPAGATSYALNKVTSSGSTELGTTTSLFFTATTSATPQLYTVTAKNSGGTSPPSNAVSY